MRRWRAEKEEMMKREKEVVEAMPSFFDLMTEQRMTDLECGM